MRVCTYNVCNLFLHGEGPAKPAKAVRSLAHMIDRVAADVVVLQEVGSADSLAALNERLRTPYPVCEMRMGNSNRSIHLGVLARQAVELTSHKHLPLTGPDGESIACYRSEADALAERQSELGLQRDLLLAELDAPGGARLALFCVHLKSRTNPRWQLPAADDVRAAECRAIRAAVHAYRASKPDAGVLLLGDFNDRLSSAALQPLLQLELVDPLGDQLRASGRNPSTYWPKRRMRIDHILLSSELARRVAPDSPTIHVSHAARLASDHYPVSLELLLDDLGNNGRS